MQHNKLTIGLHVVPFAQGPQSVADKKVMAASHSVCQVIFRPSPIAQPSTRAVEITARDTPESEAYLRDQDHQVDIFLCRRRLIITA